MFPSTIDITVSPSVTRTLRRVNQDNFGSVYTYRTGGESMNMKIRHSTDAPDADGIKMLRHNVFVERVIFPTADQLMHKYTCTATVRVDEFGSPNLAASLANGVSNWLISGTVLADLAVGDN